MDPPLTGSKTNSERASLPVDENYRLPKHRAWAAGKVECAVTCLVGKVHAFKGKNLTRGKGGAVDANRCHRAHDD